ncbi:MAG: DEAD/DEAH box helicase, partial [Bacillota bacterium]|nr:DEAD/DEAH box helicase [Bacillota bacterium]
MKDVFTEILDAMKKESRLGYGDTAVFGGFYGYIEGKLDHCHHPAKSELLELFKGYETAPLSRRREILSTAASVLSAMAIEVGQEQKAAKEEMPSLPPEPPPLQYVKGVGPKRVSSLKKLGIENVQELLEYFPRRHEDRRRVTPIAELSPGENAVICGYVKKVESHRLKKNLEITKAIISDDTGIITGVWFNQGWVRDQLKTDAEIMAYGRSDFRYGRGQFSVAEFALAGDGHGFGILPVYSLTQGLSQKQLRTIIHNAVEMERDNIVEYLPEEVRSRYDLSSRKWSIEHFHFPDTLEELSDARRRIVFDELFLLCLAAGMEKGGENYIGISQAQGSIEEFQALLPFTLTGAQKRAVTDIYKDMADPTRMLRLLEGDVGSGKTAVAAGAVYRCWRSGYQCALMAPTEILATQHYNSLVKLFQGVDINIRILTGSTTTTKKREIYEALAQGGIDLIIGTHALVEAKTRFKDLSTVIIDEQHRFGVGQRERLAAKGRSVDTLI